MPKKFKASSRKSQRLAYALIKEYSLYLSSKSIQSAPTDYWLYKAKIELKKLYVKATREISVSKPYDKFNSNIAESLKYTLEQDWTDETKASVIQDDIDANLKEFITELSIELGSSEMFTLTLKLCSQEKMNRFITYMLEYFVDNEIPISEKTKKMLIEEEHDRFIFACLKNRKCPICGSNKVDFEHWITAASLGGYKSDYGQGKYWSACRKHHSEKENIGVIEFEKKYGIHGIELVEEQVIELRKIYKNHLRGRKR